MFPLPGLNYLNYVLLFASCHYFVPHQWHHHHCLRLFRHLNDSAICEAPFVAEGAAGHCCEGDWN